MDHPITAPSEQTWRATALVASAIAGLELCLLVVLGAIYFAQPVANAIEQRATVTPAPKEHAAAAEPKAKTHPSSPVKKHDAPSLTRHETSIMILNGNGIQGAAGQESIAVHSLGYMVAGTGNAARSDIRQTVVMYRSGFEPEARRLARDLNGARVAPLDGISPADLSGAHLALVLGGDLVDRG